MNLISSWVYRVIIGQCIQVESNFSVLHTALHKKKHLGQPSTAISMEAEVFLAFPSGEVIVTEELLLSRATNLLKSTSVI